MSSCVLHGPRGTTKILRAGLTCPALEDPGSGFRRLSFSEVGEWLGLFRLVVERTRIR